MARFSGKNLLNIKCEFWYSLQPSSETFLIIRRTERDMTKNVYRFSCKVTVILVSILMKTEFSRQIFEKYSSIRFQENPSSGSQVVPCRQTDGHTWRRQQSLFAILRTRLKTLILIHTKGHTAQAVYINAAKGSLWSSQIEWRRN